MPIVFSSDFTIVTFLWFLIKDFFFKAPWSDTLNLFKFIPSLLFLYLFEYVQIGSSHYIAMFIALLWLCSRLLSASLSTHQSCIKDTSASISNLCISLLLSIWNGCVNAICSSVKTDKTIAWIFINDSLFPLLSKVQYVYLNTQRYFAFTNFCDSNIKCTKSPLVKRGFFFFPLLKKKKYTVLLSYSWPDRYKVTQDGTKSKHTLVTIPKVSSNNYISFDYSYDEKLNIPI